MSLRYGAVPALHDLDLEVARGELVVMVGESGSGKSSALKLVNRLPPPSPGRVEVDGRDVAHADAIALRRSVGMVFQRFALLPHLTVAANVAVVPELLGWKRGDIRARVDALLELVGLPPAEFRDRLPRSLSGGQQQRVGVARALAARPHILLMDEPFGALDPLTRDALGQQVRALHRALALTTLMVSHDMAEALLLADRVAVMHQGRLLQMDTPEALLRNPADDRVRQMVETPKRQAALISKLAVGP